MQATLPTRMGGLSIRSRRTLPCSSAAKSIFHHSLSCQARASRCGDTRQLNRLSDEQLTEQKAVVPNGVRGCSRRTSLGVRFVESSNAHTIRIRRDVFLPALMGTPPSDNLFRPAARLRLATP